MSNSTAGRRLATSALATAAALALAVPALAQGVWDQHGGDPGNTRQAVASGPAQPGLAWHLDVRSEGLSASTGVGSSGNLNAPVVASDGTLVRHASADGVDRNDGGNRQIGIDPADGSVVWQIEGVVPACGAASDAQGRLWVLLDDGAVGVHGGLDARTLQAYDPTTGEALAGTSLELTTANGAPAAATARWCDRTGLHVGGTGGDERLVLFDQGDGGVIAVDVSGTTPSIDWAIGPDEDPAAFDVVVRTHSANAPRIGAFTDDRLLVPTMTGDDTLELVALTLDGGGVADRLELPSYGEDGSPSTDPDDVRPSTVEVLVADGFAIAGIRTDGAYAAVHGIDLSGSWGSPAWSQTIESRATVGPSLMAVSGTNVVHNAGNSMIPTPSGDVLAGHDLTTGAPAGWSYQHYVRGTGGNSFQLLTDDDGRIYTNTGTAHGLGGSAATAFGAGGAELWSVTQESLTDAIGPEAIDGDMDLHLGVIDDDGVLYIHGDHHVVAIDGSGGLAEQRFGDVDDDHPFFDDISWLTFEEITTGYADGTWRPGLDVGRQAVAAFFYRLAGEPEVTTTAPFPDVPVGHPFHDAIAWMTDEGITTGFDDGTFRPSADVTRQAAAAFLHRLDGAPPVSTGAGFADVPADHTFHDAIAWMVDEEISGGYPDGTFRPTIPVTRQAVAAFVTRYAEG